MKRVPPSERTKQAIHEVLASDERRGYRNGYRKGRLKTSKEK